MIPRASTLEPSQLFPIRGVTTQHGVKGYCLTVYNAHSQTWQPTGKVYTGPHAWADVHRAREELVEEMEAMS